MTAFPLLLAAHAGTALVCLGLGGHVLLRHVKGDVAHRVAGCCWVVGMVLVAASSFAIRDLRDGRLSLLHVLSVVTFVSVLLGIRAAKRHDTVGQQAKMRGSHVGLVGAFVGAVAVPDRALPTLADTRPGGALAAAVAVAGTTRALGALARATFPAGPQGLHGRSRRRPPAGRRYAEVPDGNG